MREQQTNFISSHFFFLQIQFIHCSFSCSKMYIPLPLCRSLRSSQQLTCWSFRSATYYYNAKEMNWLIISINLSTIKTTQDAFPSWKGDPNQGSKPEISDKSGPSRLYDLIALVTVSIHQTRQDVPPFVIWILVNRTSDNYRG